MDSSRRQARTRAKVWLRSRPGRLACAALLLFLALAAVQLWAPFAPPVPSAPAQTAGHTGPFMLAAALGIVAWGYSVWLRCSDMLVRRCLLAIAVLLVAWLLVVTVKYPTANDLAVSIMWYLFYIPMLFAPSLCLIAVAHVAAPARMRFVRVLAGVLFAVDAALFAFVLTNNMHQMVFSFDFSDPLWSRVYEYGPGYWLVLGWIAAQYLAAFAALAVAAGRRLRRAIALPVAIAVMAAAYGVSYVFGVFVSSNIALTFSLMLVVALEMAMDLGIFPSLRSYRSIFRALPFDLSVAARADGAVAYRSDRAEPLPAEVARRAVAMAQGTRGGYTSFRDAAEAPVRYDVYGVLGGVAVVREDIAAIVAQRERLRRRREELERTSRLIGKRADVLRELERQRSTERVLALVQDAIAQKVAQADELLGAVSAAPAAADAHGKLARAKMLIGWCKHRSSLVVASQGEGWEVAPGRVSLALSETAADLRGIGVDAAVLVQTQRPLPAFSYGMVLDCMYGMAEVAESLEAPVMLAFLGDAEAAGDGAAASGDADAAPAWSLRIVLQGGTPASPVEGAARAAAARDRALADVRMALGLGRVPYTLREDADEVRLDARLGDPGGRA